MMCKEMKLISAWAERRYFLVGVGVLLAGRALGSKTAWVASQLEQPTLPRQHALGGIRGGSQIAGRAPGEGLPGPGIVAGSSSPCGDGHSGSTPLEVVTTAASKDPSGRVLILDVDGTLYGQSSGVEQQIVEGIQRYFREEIDLAPAECDAIHHRYGSTIWGLQQEGRLTQDQIERYYKEVFSSVSVRGLHASGGGGDATGYRHRANAAQMIRRHPGPVFVASNSPLPHVRRVLDAVGLGDTPFAGVLTPDTRGWLTKSSPEFYDPILEHGSVAEMAHGDLWLLDDSAVNLGVAARLGFRTLLVDGDGEGASESGREGALPLERALACFAGAIPHPEEWQFSDFEYLRSKNAVDAISRSAHVWKRLEKEVLALGLGDQHDTLRVADLGCGLMPLLEDFRSLAKACGVRKLEYCGLEKEVNIAREACQTLLSEGFSLGDDHRNRAETSGGDGRPAWRLSRGRDDESGLPETEVQIIAADFTHADPVLLFPGPDGPADIDTDVDEAASSCAAAGSNPRRRHPHVLVGCCLADLLAPASLMLALERLATGREGHTGSESGGDGGEGGGGGGDGCLVYLPITFVGKTRMVPPSPQEGLLPSDETVLQAYDACLRDQQGHHTCLDALLQTIREHGGHTLASAPSTWRVPFDGGGGADGYMWQCLLYFIGLGLAPDPPCLQGLTAPGHAESSDGSGNGSGSGGTASLVEESCEGGVSRSASGSGSESPTVTGALQPRADFPGWVRRAKERKPKLEAENVDLLFRLRGGGGENMPSRAADEDSPSSTLRGNAFLEFVAPGKVEVRQEELDEEKSVGEGQILIETICSSISSGTELKVFRGDFDSDSELDTTIKGMAGENMAYPLKYGYSLVGRVAKCGGGVDPKKFLGKLVFSFSPHSSWVVADANGVMLVPEGIEPEDAVYLPAVETALSLVHDVHPRVGESVAVFGQGMIGLLSVSILAKTHGGVGGGSVVAVDMLPERLRVAERLGATAAVAPGAATTLAPFDVSLEVTGNPRGLQSALDLTGYGGRVVLGSWYGGGAAELNLGMAFHRSHLTIQTSQVSRLPAGLTDRWDKDRRFSAAWALVRELRPSSFLTTSSPELEGAQGAYEALGKGSELGVVFRY